MESNSEVVSFCQFKAILCGREWVESGVVEGCLV